MARSGLHIAHWGAFEADTDGTTVSNIRPYAGDPDPHGIIHNLSTAQRHATRIDRPHVRAGWLDNGPGPTSDRGRDEFVPVEWYEAFELVAGELRRVYETLGAEAIYAGSYGWGSAGRFHHPQSQLRRFFSLVGGNTSSVNTYSYGASEPFLPHVFASEHLCERDATSWPVIAEHTELFVAFGGLPRKNTAVASGGNVHHDLVPWLQRCREHGTRFVGVSPLRDDMPPETGADWFGVRPGTDGALLQALAHVLITEALYDERFVRTHCVGFDRFAASVAGCTPEWAAERCGIDARRIRQLAADMASHRTMLAMSWSMQRQLYGEHIVWLGIAVAALLGQIGLPGGGFGHGYASTNYVGHQPMLALLPRMPSRANPVRTFIPVARIADMLLHPGEPYSYDGRPLVYPDVAIVYWVGGNPFHHHQDLKRLRRAFGRAQTIVVHESMWTSTARHADIVLPATLTIERDDFGASVGEGMLFPMPQLVEPYADARDDHAIFAGVADAMGVGDAFTEGRNALDWLEQMYGQWRSRCADRGHAVPSWDEFWGEGKPIEVPRAPAHQVLLDRFRADPDAHPLRTPSGRIHLQSDEIASFDYDDCPGTPTWFEPPLPTATHPLHLIANQPATRLHSQLDVGAHSTASKVRGREPVRIHPDDAAARGIGDGDVVRVHNDLGWCLAGSVFSDEVRQGVVQLSTGAWYDPDDDGNCVHGNPNVLTTDVGTSQLGQGTIGQHALVEVERFEGELPPITVTAPPPIRVRRIRSG